ncbi:MAG: hydrogenase expression/formation protein HypE [Spirochaetota bacterium]|nr:hydrogenase expression/formation protein HypE [Spirochaetota bacterium]
MSEKILTGHGSGGMLMNEMIETIIKKTLGPDSVQLDDSAILSIGNERLAFTTDTFTVTPIFFPGGDIGKLSVNGTVNDIAVMGAKPLFLSCGLVIEEGFNIDTLKRILASMKLAADYAGIKIVTGDTKVVEKGGADKIFINTSGIGIMQKNVQRIPIESGDKIIINGHIGDHGISVMAERNKLSFSKGLCSDCSPLNHLIDRITESYPKSIKFMRDATRGGVASVLNEIVKNSNLGAKLFEDDLPIRDEVIGVCELLGIDPLYVANEGKVLLIVREDDASQIVDIMRDVKEGCDAKIIGVIAEEHAGKAYIETTIGGKRILPLLIEEQLPRIC